MAVHQYVNSFSELRNAIEQFRQITMKVSSTPSNSPGTGRQADMEMQSDFPLYIIVSGAKDDNGVSWCPDCVKAEPVLEEAEKTLAPEPSGFITAYVTRDDWKNPKNEFRTDKNFLIQEIPTLFKWPNHHLKLGAEQCSDIEAIKDFLESN